MLWYYSKNNTQLGPVSEEELRVKLASGEVSPTDLIWKEGMADWRPASAVPEFSLRPTSSGGTPPAVPGIPPLRSDGSSPYTPPATSSYPSPLRIGVPIQNYLWQSIVVTVFCCLPFGIVAIVYAAKVDSLTAAGDFNGASAASATAKMWCWVSLASAVIPFLIWLLFVVFGLTAGALQSH